MAVFEHNKEAQYSQIDDDEQNDAVRQPRSRDSRWLLPSYVVLGMFCCSTGFFVGRLTGHPELQQQGASPVPYIPESLVTFEPDERYGGPSLSDSDVAWTSLSPPGDGFILVKDPSDFSLPPGKKTEGGELYDVAVFHQLHCLTKIREHASLLRIAFDTNNKAGFEKIVSPQADHMSHCFDYLRQSIMCAGDMTLEWPKKGPNGERLVVDGWGVQHQCKSWDAISQFVENNSL